MLSLADLARGQSILWTGYFIGDLRARELDIIVSFLRSTVVLQYNLGEIESRDVCQAEGEFLPALRQGEHGASISVCVATCTINLRVVCRNGGCGESVPGRLRCRWSEIHVDIFFT